MRILWIPQISSLSSDGIVLLNKDSNINFLRSLIGTKFTRTNNIYVAFEFSQDNCTVLDSEFEENFYAIFNNTRTFTNAMLERFSFDANFFQRVSKMADFDVVFVNEPAKVIPLKKIFPNSVIATYNHWLAFKNMPEIELRQFEGMKAADICFVNSDYAKNEIISYYHKRYNCKIGNIIKAQPGYDERELFKSKDKNASAEFAFVYNHRLSSDSYYLNAYQTLLRICDSLECSTKIEDMPTIYFTNPSGKDFKLDKPYFKSISLGSSEEYYNFLRSDKILGHLNTFFTSCGMWSMSTVDCAITGNICLLPKSFGYAEIFNNNYYGYCQTPAEMSAKLTKLIATVELGKHNETYSKLYLQDIIDLYDNRSVRKNSCVIVADKINTHLENLVKSKKGK